MGVSGLLFSAAMLYAIHRAQKHQQLEAGADFKSAHKIASLCVLAALGVMGYILAFHLLVGMHPA
jgi:hypothetical protein